jgi:hypothetical protein
MQNHFTEGEGCVKAQWFQNVTCSLCWWPDFAAVHPECGEAKLPCLASMSFESLLALTLEKSLQPLPAHACSTCCRGAQGTYNTSTLGLIQVKLTKTSIKTLLENVKSFINFILI